MLGTHSITSGAVDCTGFADTAVAAVAAVAQELVLEGACSESVQPHGEVGQAIALQVVDFHKTCRIECHLGVVVRN
jgi:hypothetical protein